MQMSRSCSETRLGQQADVLRNQPFPLHLPCRKTSAKVCASEQDCHTILDLHDSG